ncbi:uncharacterized protein LAESUDRAFT_809714 [Laetiporus sulphureus 93-53]|uniref:Uncharacterized protein n=1 Tax=Laetiporus sulphureus 93-53 TaxID=1314785 RepID=A0A165GU90_9APHY|nr:uncharacterized protein LAESUDRAFT_809714 [Laetiporus sulphureus 93-53]KZT10819.1 hypothetical protein LAESUDRAFT_809714 [Laetiporus sulphureus 93-53]
MDRDTPSASLSAGPIPGSQAYIPTLLSTIHATHPSLPVDTVVLQTILLCLIARIPKPLPSVSRYDVHGVEIEGGKTARTGSLASSGDAATCANLLLRTSEEDVILLAHIVSLILTQVFGIPTHRHRVPLKADRSRSPKPKSYSSYRDTTSSVEASLRALFFRRPSPLSPVRTSADITPRTDSRTPISSSHSTRRSLSQTPRPSPLRLSYFSDREPSNDGSTQHFDDFSLASSRRPFTSLSSNTPHSTLRSRRGNTERDREPLSLNLNMTGFSSPEEVLTPTPMSIIGSRRQPFDINAAAELLEEEVRPPLLVLPKAVVVTGLEHLGLAEQRALLQVLSDRQLVLEGDDGGTWDLPDDFLMVYVCKADMRERPSPLRGLLDQFAMSADITLTPSTHQAYAAFRGMPGAPASASPNIASRSLPTHVEHQPTSPLRSQPARQFSLPTTIPSQTTNSMPIVSTDDLDLLRALASPTPMPKAYAHTFMHPSLSMYIRDLFSATRHHPVLDGTLLTRRAHEAAEAFARAFRVLAGDSVGAELVQAAGSVGFEVPTSSAGMTTESASAFTGASSSSEWGKDVNGVDWVDKTSKDDVGDTSDSQEEGAVRVNLPFSSSELADSAPFVSDISQTPAESAETWDVSEVDVARVFPRVVSHRLRVRDGPDDELTGSVMFPAVDILPEGFDDTVGGEGKRDRKTVKEVLVEILADV